MDESDGGPTVMHWFRERPTLLLWTRSASFLRCSMQGWSAVAGGWPDRLAVDGVAYGSARGGAFHSTFNGCLVTLVPRIGSVGTFRTVFIASGARRWMKVACIQERILVAPKWRSRYRSRLTPQS